MSYEDSEQINERYFQQQDFPVAQMVNNLPKVQETRVWSLGQEDPLEKGMATHYSILAWRIPWTEKPGGLQSMGSQRVGHDRVTNTHTSNQIRVWAIWNETQEPHLRGKWDETIISFGVIIPRIELKQICVFPWTNHRSSGHCLWHP